MTEAKTFPIRTTNEWLKKVKEAAQKTGSPSMHSYVVEAVSEKVEKDLKEGE